MNKTLMTTASLGLLSVITGAYIDHVGKNLWKEHAFQMMQTALHYHQMYALLACLISLLVLLKIPPRIAKHLKAAAWLFVSGIFLFSGSIYFANIFSASYALKFAPVGGYLFMLGWAWLIYVGWIL